MRDINIIAAVAVSMIETFMRLNGFEPSGGWDINYPECFRAYGEHCVITVCGHALCNTEFVTMSLWDKFTQYVIAHDKLPSAIKFAPYNLERYDHPEATYIILSVAY